MAKNILLIFLIVLGVCVIPSHSQVDGNWADWNAWHACTASCDGGLRIRFRDCDNPPPSDGGDDCPGYGSESADCNTQQCPVDGGWTDFSDWLDCSVTCGGGVQNRIRTCSNPAPAHGGASCTGVSQESRSCGEAVCPTNGKWTNWGAWTECNTDCNSFRYRTCTNPEPANGGHDCPGKSREKYECSIEDCPVNGQWGAWTAHDCDRTCRGYKTRRCDDPPPLRGGKACVGNTREEYGDCTGYDCVENGNWGLWSQWSKCSKTCMHGIQIRTRQCNNPTPRNGGKECPEEDQSEQEKPCYLQTCPVPPDYVRKVKRKKPSEINFGLILGTIFGSMGGLIALLLITLSIRKYQLKKRRDKIVEEREQSKLYKDAAEMSIIPEGKRSQQARLRRQQLKSKLKRNGKLSEQTPLMLMDEDGFELDEFDEDGRPFSSMSSRPGSAASRPGTARLRPSAYGREASSLEREDSELYREVTLLDIFQDAEYLKRANSDLDREETSFFGNDEEDNELYRSDTQMSLETGNAPDGIKGPRSLLETPRPESTRPQSREMRVDTPMMMKGLEELDQQLRDMAGFATDGQDASVPGGITNLTELLGGGEKGDKEKGLDTLGFPSNMKNQPTAQDTNGGMSLNSAMNQKVVVAQINHHPTAVPQGDASGGIPNLQAAMSKKGGSRSESVPGPPPQLPNQEVFSRHSSLPGIAVQSPTGAPTFEQVTSGKQVGAQLQQPPPSPKANLGISLQAAMSGKGLAPEQAMAGKELAPVTPPPNRRKGVGMMLDQNMMEQGVTPTKMGKSVSVDEALSSLAKPQISNAPSSPGFSPRRASMATVSITIEESTEKQTAQASGGRVPRGGGMNLREAMAAETGQTQEGKQDSTGKTLNEVMAAKTGHAQTRKPDSGGMNLREAMAAKTGQTQERKRGYDSVEDAMSAKTGKQQTAAPRKLMKQLPNLPPPDKDKFWEVPRESIELVTNIAFGTMGPVWKAKAWDIVDNEDVTSVAIKTLNDGCTATERTEFEKELELLKRLDPHPNIVGLLGCCTYVDPLYMILEYARHDALLDYLRRNRPGKENARTPSSQILVNFAVQVAKGMQYLSKVKLPHGDLTTRNILLGERMICKISNFSRERDIAAIVGEPRHGVRWMGVEAIANNEYTTSTDVWSFGVLLWEIVTYGATPYPKMHGREVKSRVPTGYRMELPSHCSKELYGIMLECWNNDPGKRPSFRSITIVMEKLLADKKDYVQDKKYERSKYESTY